MKTKLEKVEDLKNHLQVWKKNNEIEYENFTNSIYETDSNFTLQAGDILILEGSLHHLKKLSGCFL